MSKLIFDPANAHPVMYGPGAFCIEELESGSRLVQFRFEVTGIPIADMNALAERWTDDLVQVLRRIDVPDKPTLEYI